MPLILPESKINEWINPETNPEKIAMEAVNAIISYIFIFQLPDLLDPSLSITCFFMSEDISLWTVFSDFPILIAISNVKVPRKGTWYFYVASLIFSILLFVNFLYDLFQNIHCACNHLGTEFREQAFGPGLLYSFRG